MVDLITSALQLEKRCIFCGNRPSDKSREHIIPQWLIGMTGDPKRTWHLGVKFGDSNKPDRRFAADQFQFPACEPCNASYSELEGRTKANMARLLAKERLTAIEWDDVLDWFDKVRVGLFIGNMLLNKDLPIPDPKFFIDQRVGTKDRCILVYPAPANHVGLRMIGAGDPLFFHMPTCFMLLVNNLLFLNVSSDFLLAPRMGFPFPQKLKTAKGRTYPSEFRAVLRPKIPFIRFAFYRPETAVFQTILARELIEHEDYARLVHQEYVQQRLLAGSATKTKLCTTAQDEPMFLKGDDQILSANIPDKQIRTFDEYCLRFFEFRRFSVERALADEGLNAFDRRLARLMVKFNGYAIEQTKSGIYSL